MRAYHFSSTSPTLEANLKLKPTAPLPPKANSLARNQLLVRVLATSINPADYKFPSFPIFGRLIVPRPSAPGIDFAGRVTHPGPSTSLTQGTLVFGRLANPQKHGTLGEYVVATTDEVVPLPEGVSPLDAACVGTAGLIAYQSITPHVKPGDNVFINGGSGGTGIFSIQIAKQLGCWVTTTTSPGNVELCKQLGADEVIDYRKGSVVDSLRQTGRKFQLVVDNIGADPKLWSRVEDYTSPGAPFLQVGLPISFASFFAVTKSKFNPPPRKTPLLYTDYQRDTLWPSWLGAPHRRYKMALVYTDTKALAHMGQWLAEGKVKVVKDRVYPYSEAQAAFAQLRAGHVRGKIVIEGPADE